MRCGYGARMQTVASRLRRRLPLLTAAAVATAGMLATVAPASHDPRPTIASYTLPGQAVFPEGVAVQDDYYYVTSTATGTIFRGRLDRPRASVYLAGGANGRTTAIGLEAVRKRLIVAGGATGRVFVYSTATRNFVRDYTTGPAPGRPTFVNDATAAPNGDIYVTDSLRPILHRIPADSIRHRSTNTDALSVFLDLTGSAFQQQPGNNANGIEATPDGRYLLVVQSNTGKLFRIGIADRSVTEVSLGAETLRNGDGLELQGQRLYVARNRDGIVVRVDMSRDYASGRVVRAITGSPFGFPTTLAGYGRRLLVVNSQLDRSAMAGQPAPAPPVEPFTVSSVRRP